MASSAQQNPLDELAAKFEPELARYVREISRQAEPNLHDAMAYALGLDIEDAAMRGKRIRPALCLLSAQALGAELERAYPFALAIELMHTFCLVHDDIEDGDTMRRGRPSVWSKYGVAHAINVGDYLHVHTTRALTDWPAAGLEPATRLRLVQQLGRALDHTHVGQALDINARARDSIGIEDYFRLVREKTGFYLAAPIQGGAIVGGADDKTVETIGELADLLGPMFQIMDDIIDLTEGKGRQSAGSDICEGKRSYLVAHGAANCSEADRERLFDILNRPREQTTADDVAWATELFERTGAIEAGRARCETLFDQSAPVLERLPKALGAALGPALESLARRTR